MGSLIKKAILDYQLNKCHKQYEHKLSKLSDPYGMWIKNIEKSSLQNSDFEIFCRGRYLAVMAKNGIADVPKASSVPADFGLLYTDEDLYDPDLQKRYAPWMKPDYSPDTLLSFFYFGSLVLFDIKYLKEAIVKRINFSSTGVFYEKLADKAEKGGILFLEESDQPAYYDFILSYTEFLSEHKIPICHLPQILYHNIKKGWQPEDPEKPEVVNEDAYWGYETCYDICKKNALQRRKLNGSIRRYKALNGKEYGAVTYDTEGEPLVSVIIPSKDNAEVLSVCLKSIYEKNEYVNFEIIIVDNGSNEKTRAVLEELKSRYKFTYIYELMSFNFSKMCNLGVKAAAGEYVLFINDDIEVRDPDFMKIMLGQAMLPHVGAVGVKLLYPETDKIQHAGITNLWVGPAHKLLKESDKTDYYYGRNRLPYDMIGVTAACLMISKEKYNEVGGFCEDIAVSYNDVDFCFSLYNHGYYNVERCDVTLFHHESISRGDDTLSEEKWNRLLHEKDLVYERHPDLKGKDPFYNPNLAGFKHKYFCSYLYAYEQRNAYNIVYPWKKPIQENWNNNCLSVTIEHIRLERKLDLKDEKDVYWIEGWAYVLGMDSSRYDRKIFLTDKDGKVYFVRPFDRYRPDVVNILPLQINVAISGFSCRIRQHDLKPGKYSVAVLYSDQCSRQKLYKKCEEVLIVT